MADDPNSSDRVRRTVRLDPAGWLCLCRIADAYWEGKRHPATDVALLDAIMSPTPFPTEPTRAFNEALAAFVEVAAGRLNLRNKKFYFGADVAAALVEASGIYPKVERATAADPLPFVRRLPSGNPAVPTAPWAISIPLHYAGKVPDHDLRAFIDGALVAKAARIGLSEPKKTLPPPVALPCIESVLTGRHLDEALVAILAALPWTAPNPDERLQTTLRFLRTALLARSAT